MSSVTWWGKVVKMDHCCGIFQILDDTWALGRQEWKRLESWPQGFWVCVPPCLPFLLKSDMCLGLLKGNAKAFKFELRICVQSRTE